MRKWIFGALAFFFGTCFVIPILQDNAQKWAEAHGYDQLMLVFERSPMTYLEAIFASQWFALTTGFFVGGAAALWLEYFLRGRSKLEINAKPIVLEQKTLVSLLVRKNQEPLELPGKQNVHRWFIYNLMGIDPLMPNEPKFLGVQIVLTFERPAAINYRRISCSNHEIRLNVIDVGERSAIISSEMDLTGTTIEIVFSQTPL